MRKGVREKRNGTILQRMGAESPGLVLLKQVSHSQRLLTKDSFPELLKSSRKIWKLHLLSFFACQKTVSERSGCGDRAKFGAALCSPSKKPLQSKPPILALSIRLLMQRYLGPLAHLIT